MIDWLVRVLGDGSIAANPEELAVRVKLVEARVEILEDRLEMLETSAPEQDRHDGR